MAILKSSVDLLEGDAGIVALGLEELAKIAERGQEMDLEVSEDGDNHEAEVFVSGPLNLILELEGWTVERGMPPETLRVVVEEE